MNSRRALISGTSSGIGAAIAKRLLGEGWRVTGLDRAAPVIQHPQFDGMRVDLIDTSALTGWLNRCEGADAFIHAAGILRVGRLGELDEAAGEALWAVNVRVATQIANRLAPGMPQGGRIVLIGSRTSSGSPGRGQYAAAKAALVGLARSWAMELAPRGITVNVIAPGATDTAMLRDPARASVTPSVPPIGRLIKPGEVAALAAFLLSEDAAAITGQQIMVCGGASL
jgi:NAD(P)-dependent dehydrogenase (short-subunit alcohol dehydrogenase family)